ncbi:MAG: peptide-methionine (S)-S-oxide reductase MsrA [Porticoccaceae bacterium]
MKTNKIMLPTETNNSSANNNLSLGALLAATFILLLGFAQASTAAEARAIFAGGCFWCMEEAFETVDGVSEAVSGYIGGDVPNPSYPQVSGGGTGHTEAIEVLYDSETVNYDTLLAVFWRNIDPLDARGQFCDKGSQYRSGIFYLDEQQHTLAQSSKDALVESKVLKGPIQTEITAATSFYPAEDYHQNYYLKNPKRYKFYKWNCGRKQQLDYLWDKLEPGG